MGLFGKKKGLVGVDIGSSAVKAVELKVGGKAGDEYQLLNIGIEPLPPEAIVDGAIMDSGAVIDSIQRLFQENKIKTSDVATGVSGNAVIVKKISLPQMTAEELQESIHWEAEQYIPFDIQDVQLDYELIEGAGSGGNMDVLLVAANVANLGGRVAFDYRTSIDDLTNVHLSGAARYVGKSRLGVGPVLGQTQGDYVDTSLSATLTRGSLQYSLSLTNVLDSNGNRFSLGTPFDLNTDYFTPLRPRTVRIGLDFAF